MIAPHGAVRDAVRRPRLISETSGFDSQTLYQRETALCILKQTAGKDRQWEPRSE